MTCIPCTMKASFNAELYAAVAAGQHVDWVRDAALAFGVPICGPTAMLGDNESVICMAEPGAVCQKSKPDARRVGIMQELAAPNGPIAPEKVHTDYNRVDCMTKHVDIDKQWRSMCQLTNAMHRVPPKVTTAEKVAVAIELLGGKLEHHEPKVKQAKTKQPPAISTTDVGVPTVGCFILYLGAGLPHEGDFASWVDAAEAAGWKTKPAVVNIEIKIGKETHDLRRTAVVEALVAAATCGRCVGVLVSLECTTWSAAHFLPDKYGKPGRPWCNANYVLGIPGADGDVPERPRRVAGIGRGPRGGLPLLGRHFLL